MTWIFFNCYGRSKATCALSIVASQTESTTWFLCRAFHLTSYPCGTEAVTLHLLKATGNLILIATQDWNHLSTTGKLVTWIARRQSSCPQALEWSILLDIPTTVLGAIFQKQGTKSTSMRVFTYSLNAAKNLILHNRVCYYQWAQGDLEGFFGCPISSGVLWVGKISFSHWKS